MEKDDEITEATHSQWAYNILSIKEDVTNMLHAHAQLALSVLHAGRHKKT